MTEERGGNVYFLWVTECTKEAAMGKLSGEGAEDKPEFAEADELLILMDDR